MFLFLCCLNRKPPILLAPAHPASQPRRSAALPQDNIATANDFDTIDADMAIMLVACPTYTVTIPRGVALYSVNIEVILPPKYIDYASVFSEENATKYLVNTTIQHLIKIKEGVKAPYSLIYPLSANKLRVLREYLNTHLARR
jgi:hypothetical protein